MKKKEYILHYDMVFGNVLSLIILVLMVIITFVIINLNDSSVFSSLNYDTFIWDFILFYILMFGWMILHEIIHAIAYRLNGAKKDSIVFGVALEKGVFYCKCRDYISKKCVMISLIAPFLVIGVITYVIGFLINSLFLISLSIINICGASCDLMMFVFFLKQKNDIEFKELGFSSPFCLRTSDNLENKKFIGIKDIHLVKDINETIEPPEKKITISKFSWIILTILAVMMLLILLLNIFL